MGVYWLSFLTGLLGSAHCLGMCGPIVLAYSVQLREAQPQRSGARYILHHAFYNLGRVLMWAFLGLLLATASGVVQSLLRFERGFALLAGVAMIGVGCARLGFLPAFDLSPSAPAGRLGEMFRRAFRLLIREGTLTGTLALGLLNGLLPCGLSYALLIRAAASGSPASGLLIMVAFGLGTVPALFFAGALSTKMELRLSRWGERTALTMVVLLGLLLVLRGFGLHLRFLMPQTP